MFMNNDCLQCLSQDLEIGCPKNHNDNRNESGRTLDDHVGYKVYSLAIIKSIQLVMSLI